MKTEAKNHARELRRQGLSIKEICKKLGVAKSSVSIWVRDIELRADQLEALNLQMIRSRQRFGYLSRCDGANKNRIEAEQRHRLYEQSGRELAKVDERFRLVCALYWAEGKKRGKNTFSISNSDPRLMRVFLDWLVRSGFDQRIAFRVQYYEGNGFSVEMIKAWWRNKLPRLDGKHFRKFVKCTLNRASQQKKVGSLPYGTATIEVCDSELFFNVMGGIKYLQDLGDW